MSHRRASLVTSGLIIALVVGLIGFLTPQRAAAAAITPGNIVVYRVGNGVDALVNTGSPVFLDEYSPAGALVQSIPLPTAVSGANRRLIASGTATSEGMLTRSADGRFLLLTGYDADMPTMGLAGSLATVVNRVVGRVDAAGNVDTSTALSDFVSADNPRSATSSDGGDIWVTGGAGGVRYTTLGATTSSEVAALPANGRNLGIFDGQLYVVSHQTAHRGVSTVGVGLPTAAGQTSTLLPGLGTGVTTTTYGFALLDLDVAVPGVDTLYTANEGSGLRKFSLVGGAWALNGFIGGPTEVYRGLAAVEGASSVTLYATRYPDATVSTGGELVSIVDNSGYNGAFAPAVTSIATAVANTAFRGVALAPGATPTITWPSPAPIVYGTALSAAELNATAEHGGQPVPGSFSYAPPLGTLLESGDNQVLSVTFTPDDTTLFASATVTTTINVAPAPLTITADDKERYVGSENPPLTASYTGFVNGDTPAALDAAPVLTTTATITSPVGAYPIVASGAADANYDISYVSGMLTVTARLIPTVTWAAPAGITYGTPLGAAQLNAAAADGAQPLAGTFAYTPAAGTVLEAGAGQTLTVVFTPDDGVAYDTVTATVTIDVAQAPLTITADNKVKQAGAANPPLTASYSGFVNGDGAADLDAPPVLSTTATAASPAGAYPIVVSGAADSNYSITFVNGTLTVQAAPPPSWELYLPLLAR